MSKITLVRHCQTNYNSEKRYQGWTDIKLNQKGRREAEKLGNAFKGSLPEKIYSSSLSRARETTQILRGENEADFAREEDLRELNFGRWEGKTWEEIKKQNPRAEKEFDADIRNFHPPGGESILSMKKRVLDFWENIKGKKKDTLLVSHTGPIKLILLNVLKASLEGFWNIHIDPGSISVIKIFKNTSTVVKMNKTSHLTLKDKKKR